ncbi:MAG: RagB/SusD family nutrient uptake outer membrane protein, partial [Muribaculaceae bacterium]|nr:RagB/SusD family nutrient uptake outer membrane protein [Muribaculaceae bacterium]
MKSFIKYIAAGVIALSCVSCLDLTPKDQLSDPDLWSKPGDFENLANKFYDWIPTFDRTYGDWHADKSSDLLRDKGGTNTLSNGTNTIPQNDGTYTDTYKHVRRC